jgi:hypothetical protein
LTSSADVSESVPSLVVAKGNTLEVWDAEVDGLKKVAETEVWGMIVGLEWVCGGNDGEHVSLRVSLDKRVGARS